MAIRKTNKGFQIVCDSCGVSPDHPAETFVEALGLLESMDWDYYRVGADYHTECRNCLEA